MTLAIFLSAYKKSAPLHLTVKQQTFSTNKARRTRHIKRFKLFKPVIPHLPPECERAIASNTFSPELSRLVDVAIVQAEARYALEFVGVAS